MDFKTILLVPGFTSMAVAMMALSFGWCKEHDFHPLRELLSRFRRLPLGAKLFLVMFAAVFIVYGSTKTDTQSEGEPGGTNAPPEVVTGGETNAPPEVATGGETNAPPPLLMMAGRPVGTTSVQQQGLAAGLAPAEQDRSATGFTEAQIAARAAIVGVRTNETHDFSMPAGAHVVERWRRRGAANERVKLGVGETASVQQQDGAGETPPPQIEGETIAVDTFGRIKTRSRVFSLLGIQIGMVPMANWGRIGAASLCWWMTTASNSTVVCWQNALLNRDTNTPVCVLAEFQDNGKFEYRYDLSSLGEAATNVFARIETTNGVEGVALGVGVTTVRGHLLGPDDGWVEDKDNDGLSTHDEIFIYGTDPELPDTDGDGRTDGEEVWNGGDPLSGDVSDAEIVARIAAGVTNEEVRIVERELKSTKLWDGFAFYADPETNVLYTRTFEIDRKEGWTSFFLSGKGEDWCFDGEGAIQDWSLIGCEVAWEDDTGASGSAMASPRNDTLYLPLGTNATSVTITLRPIERNLGLAAEEQDGQGTASVQQQVGAGRRASPSPVYLLEYSPKIRFPSGQEFSGDDGNTYCVLTDPNDLSFGVDDSNRPCRAAAGEGEATESDFRMPSGPGVYRLPLAGTVEPDAHPLLLMASLLGAPPSPPNDRYLVIIEPWVSYGSAHYGCWHDYPYDWGWYGWWCDCEPGCGCGIDGYSAVNAYIEWYDGWECEGVVEVGGVEVWRGCAYHVVWACDHDHDDDGYCPCGCDETCQYCSCVNPDGVSQGSIRFRVGLGTDYDDQKIGFAWFESDGPVQIRPQIFEVDSRPDVYVREQDIGGAKYITTYETHGRDLAISPIEDGVSVAVKHHGAAQPFETWELTNMSNSWGIVRIVKRGAAETAPPQGGTASGQQQGPVIEDWTYSCTWRYGEWVWDVTDNIDHSFVPDNGGVVQEDGTNSVYGADGRLERLTVCTNGEEIVIRSFGYDEEGRLVLVDDGTNGCVTIAYDGAGNISEMTGPEGTLRAAWDADGVMTNLDTSAWNGPVPNPRPPLMAPRTGLLGATNGGETITPGEAFDHYRDGTGAPMSMPFSEVDTSMLTPTEFECVRSFISSCHEPYSYEIEGNRVIATKGKQQYFLGHITVHLHGYITYLGGCAWQFEGTMTALDDTYDFNKAMRGRFGERLTSIGRALLTGNGKAFTISFTGSKPLTGSGHCHQK